MKPAGGNLFCLLLLLMLLSVSHSTQPVALAAEDEVEIAYDDGHAESTWSKKEAGGFDAVRFSLPFRPAKLLAAKYYIEQKPAEFSFLFLGSDRNPAYERKVTPSETGWFTVDLSDAEIVVWEEFYVAMKWIVEEAPYLGADETGPDGRSFFVDGKWSTYKEAHLAADNEDQDGDLMIRVTVAPTYWLDVKDKQSKEPFYVGDIGSVTYVIQNTGTAVAENVELKVTSAPSSIQIVEVTPTRDLEPGSTGEWEVRLKANEPGEFEVGVSFYVNGEKLTFATDSGTVDEFKIPITATQKTFLQLYLAGGVIVLLIAVIAIVLTRRRRAAVARAAATAVTAPHAPPTVSPPSAGKFCINCGSSMPQTSQFCPRCGARQQ